MVEQLALYFSYDFVRYAFIVGLMISICSSLLGVVLVLRRYSYIGDGLSHVAFGAMALAFVLRLASQKMLIILPITVIGAVWILRNGSQRKIHGDAMMAMVSVGSLALGYLLMNRFPTSNNIAADVCSSLFGSTSILSLSAFEVISSAVLSLFVLGVFFFLYPRIFAVTFDETFSKTTGLKVSAMNYLMAILIAVMIVLAMNLVGSLLISALVIFPALSAMQLFKSFKQVLIAAMVISGICTTIGMLGAILLGTPVGATIVVVDMIIFLGARLCTRN